MTLEGVPSLEGGGLFGAPTPSYPSDGSWNPVA